VNGSHSVDLRRRASTDVGGHAVAALVLAGSLRAVSLVAVDARPAFSAAQLASAGGGVAGVVQSASSADRVAVRAPASFGARVLGLGGSAQAEEA